MKIPFSSHRYLSNLVCLLSPRDVNHCIEVNEWLNREEVEEHLKKKDDNDAARVDRVDVLRLTLMEYYGQGTASQRYQDIVGEAKKIHDSWPDLNPACRPFLPGHP